jgi:hypothetical protein
MPNMHGHTFDQQVLQARDQQAGRDIHTAAATSAAAKQAHLVPATHTAQVTKVRLRWDARHLSTRSVFQ